MNEDLVILYSGGADSRLTLDIAIQLGRRPYCVLIDYGQKHIEELKYAQKQLEELNVQHQIVKISNLQIDSGLTGDNVEGQYENVNPMNVPARNTIFISIAASVAESRGVREIWYGPDFSDRLNLFPDCYQDYVVKMNEVLNIGCAKPIILTAPLLGWTKEMVLEYLDKQLSIKEKDLYSGYEKNDGDDSDELQ